MYAVFVAFVAVRG